MSDWIKSQQPHFIRYVEPVKRQSIDGLRLRNLANDRILDWTKVKDEDRVLMQRSFDQLRSHASNEFYRQFQDDSFHILVIIMQDKSTPHETCQMKIESSVEKWMKPLPKDAEIDGMEFLHSRGRYAAFLRRILDLAAHHNPNSGFMHMPAAELINLGDYQKMIARFNTYRNETQHQHHKTVCIVRGWYGCSHAAMSEIARDGFTHMVKLGPREKDRGFCLKSSAKAAAKDAGASGCVIMCYMILRHAYPTVIGNRSTRTTSNRFRYYSNGEHSPIQEEEEGWKNHIRRWSSNPKSETVDEGLYDEFVTDDPIEIYPQVVIYLRPTFPVLKYLTGWVNST